METIVERGVRLGQFATADVGVATLGLLGMCNWVVQWYRPDGRLGPAEIGRLFADLVLEGLEASPSEVGASPSVRPGTARPESRQTSG